MMTSAGALPLSCRSTPTSLADAVAKYGTAAPAKGFDRTMRDLEEPAPAGCVVHRHPQGRGAGGLPGGLPGGGKIQIP